MYSIPCATLAADCGEFGCQLTIEAMNEASEVELAVCKENFLAHLAAGPAMLGVVDE